MPAMFGILLAGIGSAFSEISDSIGKKTVQDRLESLYTFGFLNLLFGTLFLVIHGFVRHSFLFSIASLPFFIPRLALEILQAHVGALAVIKADRSDYGFLRVLTIPLLLMVDVISGYSITTFQVAGIALILGAAFALYSLEHYKTKGFWLICFTAVNAVITISLFKYDISHFNSVESEQAIIMSVLALYFFLLAAIKARENPLSIARHPVRIAQTVSSGLGSYVSSFAYLFAPASIIMAAVRATAVLFSILSGKLYFREKRTVEKLFLFLVITLGLFLLTR